MSKTDEHEPEEETADVSSAEEANPLEWEQAANNQKDPDERRTVSKREEKDDARKIVTGEAKYAADYAPEFPDLGGSKIVCSEVAHGRVKDSYHRSRVDGRRLCRPHARLARGPR